MGSRLRNAKLSGANLSGAVQQLSLVAALAFAMILLDEKLTVLRVIGIAFVVCGPLIMTSRRGRPKEGGGKKTNGDFQPNILAGYTAGFLATLGYGLSPTLVRAGLAETSNTKLPL